MISKASFCFIVTIIAGKSDKTMIKCHTIRIVRQTEGQLCIILEVIHFLISKDVHI